MENITEQNTDNTLSQMPEGSIVELRDVSLYHSRKPLGRCVGSCKKVKCDELVLSGINLAVGRGELVYLIGRVGSGKSTLLRTLYAETPLCHGYGRVVGYDLSKLRRRDIPYLRRKIGVVFQDYKLLTDRNVFDNLYFVMKATGWKDRHRMREKIEEVLRLVGLANKEYKMPFQLSGGEQQRLAIARALINDPQVILADEPTGNLDPAAADEVMSLFRKIVEGGCSIIMSTHNINNIRQCPSRTVRFSRGVVEEIDINAILGDE